MAGIVENVATHGAESLADKAMHELEYLCCYKSYVEEFEKKKESLESSKEMVLYNIEKAKNRNETRIVMKVKLWLRDAEALINEDTKGKKKWFGLVPNCFWQYNRGRDLEGKKRWIEELVEVEQSKNLTCVACSTGFPGIEFYSIENFMQLKDRELKFEELTEALTSDKLVIGLYGLGGTGKTTMAVEVGVEVAKAFDKVIFSNISKDPNLKKIRDNIAKQLDLNFKGETDESKQVELWKRIAEGGEKVLIILDDVWEKLSLKDIGIPLGGRGKNCCSILLTTRDWEVCRDMGCHETIELEVLNEQDAVDLFLSYAAKSIDDSSDDYRGVALGIVKECGRLPVAIVAIARALKSKPLKQWKDGLKRLQNSKSIHDVNEELKEAYNSLRLSYDYLKNEKAKKLFLLCALFPDDYEIPIELLTRIAIGMGLCGGANKYSDARSLFTPIIDVLMDSCLLLKVENEAVKMHDLVREVALWIGNKLVQAVMDSSTTLVENIQYSSWNINEFPSNFDGRKLKVLLLWKSNNAEYATVKVPDGIFEGMENLKILALMNWSNIRISGASLLQSHPSLINVRSLTIKGFELGDISILANLKNLVSLELSNCSMVELPKKIRELEKLRVLEMVQCDIEINNPFEVFGSCWKLEELYFVSNRMDKDTCESLAQITTFPKLESYQIKARHGSRSYKVDFSISGYFDSRYLRVNFSDELFKSLVARAEVLKLGGDYYNRGWTNVVPDVLPLKDDSMEDHLARLCLQSMNGIKCLIRTERLRSSVAIFSKLVKLKLSQIDVKELCCGPYPVNFLKKLEKLDLSRCENLEGLLFAGKLELCNLKSIYLNMCSMACLFHPFTAQSLKQLEMLHITCCSQLKYIVAEPMDDHDPNQKSDDSMFPKLKYLKIESCHKLEFILPICFCKDLPLLESMEILNCEKLEYIFGRYSNERDLHQVGKEAVLQWLEKLQISMVPNFINLYAECYLPCPSSDKVQKSSPSTNVEDCTSSLSRGCLCCFRPKSNASTIHHPSTSTNHNEAMKVNYVVNRAHGLFTPPLYPYTLLRRLGISELVGLKSLFTLSIVSSLKLLEILTVGNCDTIEHIVTDKEDDHDHMNVNSIFPNLREVQVSFCNNLEFLFPACYSKDFKDLEFVSIAYAEKLSHIFGKCQADQNHNVHIDLNLPKRLFLSHIPNKVSICAQNYSMKEVYLEVISLDRCPQLPLETLIDLLVAGHKSQEDLSRIKALPPLEEKGKPLHNLQELPEFKEPKSYRGFQNLTSLTVKGYKQLKFIFSASTLRRLQKLRELEVEECEELVSIIEDQENNKTPTAPHQVLFPELRTIKVRACKSMEYLFSISSGELPRLLFVDIEDIPQVGEVFRWKHGEGQKLVMKDVFPKLYMIRLVNLPTLHTICQGIDFHTVKLRCVRKCPTISLTSTKVGFEELKKLQQPFERNFVHEEEDASYFTTIIRAWQYEEYRGSIFIPDYTRHKQNHISQNLSEIEAEGSQKDIGNDSTMPQQNNGSPAFKNSEEVSKEIAEEDSTTKSNLSNLTKNLKATFGEGPSSKKYDKASSSKLWGKESMDDDQQAHGESRSSNGAPQRIEEHTKELSSKETSNEVSLKIPPPSITTMTSALSSSISSPKKPQIATLTSHEEMELGSSQCNLLTIFAITDESIRAEMESSKAIREGFTEHKQNRISPHLSESEEVSKEIAEEDSTTNSNLPNLRNLTKRTKTTANEIVEEKFFATPSSDLDVNLKATFGEGHSSEKYGKASSSKEKTMDQPERSTAKQVKFDQGNHQQFAEDDLMRLFQIMEEGAETEVHMPHVSKIAAVHDDNKLIKALADLEGSLKMSLNEIASSKESRFRLENALNVLSSHCSEHGAPTHELQTTIRTLQQEIQNVLSSSKQAYATIDIFNKLEHKEKLFIEERLKRKEAAVALLSEIYNKESSLAETSLKEAELKEQISKLQDELDRKEKQVQEYEMELISLKEQKKKSVYDTMGFIKEFEAVKKERSHMVEENINAKEHLQNMDAKWSSCLSSLKKTTLLLGVHLRQKL